MIGRAAAVMLAAMPGPGAPSPATAQTATVGPCRVRLSLLRSFAPLQSAVPTGERLDLRASSDALADFDRALAAAIAGVPVSDETAFAMTDAERLVEGMERCADALGVTRARIGRSGAALDDAYRRNAATMRRADFAERLLRSPRAQKVLAETHQTATIDAAREVKAANDAERRRERVAAQQRSEEAARRREEGRQAELAAAEVQRRVAAAPIRHAEQAWRANRSAPAPGARMCDDDAVFAYRDQPKGAAWLAVVGQEIGRCARISSRRDGVYFNGLALGTAVTDEQLAHAVGRSLICLSTSDARTVLDAANGITDGLAKASGLGGLKMEARPIWSERRIGPRRIVQVRCEISLTMLGIDFQQMQRAFGQALRADADPYVEYDLAGGRLVAIRIHEIRPNEQSQVRTGNFTQHYCDETLGQADTAVRAYAGNGWRQLARLPYRYTMRNDAFTSALVGETSPQVGRWYTLQRGAVFLDVFNTRYAAPVLGQNGGCYGGAVDYVAMLAPARATRVKPGARVDW